MQISRTDRNVAWQATLRLRSSPLGFLGRYNRKWPNLGQQPPPKRIIQQQSRMHKLWKDFVNHLPFTIYSWIKLKREVECSFQERPILFLVFTLVASITVQHWAPSADKMSLRMFWSLFQSPNENRWVVCRHKFIGGSPAEGVQWTRFFRRQRRFQNRFLFWSWHLYNCFSKVKIVFKIQFWQKKVHI